MSGFKFTDDFQSADIGGTDRRARVDPGKLLDLIARMKAASGNTVKAPPRPVKTKAS